MGTATKAQTGSGLDTSTPVGYFTSLADRLLQSQMNLSVTNIPVFTNNTFVYGPPVNRLLQLAANIYDATTNRTFDGTNSFPSVFRPTFKLVDGSNVFISGFVEEGAGMTSYQARPLGLPEDLALVGPDTTNIYGVPWIIGAKKGLPNFNEFSTQLAAQITRKLEIAKPSIGAARSTWVTNQMYVIGISNSFGVEAWNSYSNAYPRNVDILVANELAMVLTNEYGLYYATNLVFGESLNLAASSWAGFSNSLNPAANAVSFQIPLLTNFVFLPDSVYHEYPPALIDLTGGFEQNQTNLIVPHFVLGTTNRLRFIMLDHDTGRVIDYVHLNLSGTNTVRELTAELTPTEGAPGVGGVWNTNLVNGALEGIGYQLAISAGVIAVSLNEWNNSQLQQFDSPSKQAAINGFHAFYIGTDTSNLVEQVPFTPTRETVQNLSWQANDPLVHYTLNDLTDLKNASNGVSFVVPPNGRFLPLTNQNIGQVNYRYQPWGGNPFNPDANSYNLALKDPLIKRSDDWNFPNGAPLVFGWLGSVHRGTPWQTVYLKSAPVDPLAWQLWTGDGNSTLVGNTIFLESELTEPTNDWKIAALFASLLNTNSPRALLSINQINLNTWGQTFSAGLTVLSNDTTVSPPQFTALVMDANSPQAAVIVNGINNLRAAQPGGWFYNVGDVLAAPELSAASPWLNLTNAQLQYGISDAAYEIIPSQILPWLRIDSAGSIAWINGAPRLQFTGFDGYGYRVETSTNLLDWTVITTLYPTNGIFNFTDASGPADQRYYRTELAP